ncbi:cysteine--tRNA ligase, partial [Patescibacteria group bacterium]|nr:cysteine--tRNA ligase [Patescibacteria group bacterium]
MLKIENTLSRRKEQFKPLGKEIGMYVCGPTSYGPGHAGHARTYIAFDVIRRYLEYKGYKVKFVMNITDVHDDIFKRVEKENTTLHALTNKYTNQFLSETNLLGIKKADCYPRVTRHVEEIIGFIKILINKGFAYSKDSSVYFDVSKFPDYGKLSGVEIGETLSGTRVETDKYKKKKAIDFALWKKSKPGEGLGWKSPWGHGRPGWHIECSVMSQKYLGEQFDIHGGAMDLIFPHHENEIAQSEAASGKSPFVKYWLHGGLLTINGEKMSRSLGNYITISELLMNYSPRLLRYFVIQSHYRSPVDFNKDAIEEAKQSLQRIDMFVHRIDKIALDDTAMRTEGGCEIVKVAVEEFENCMDDDFNTPATLA